MALKKQSKSTPLNNMIGEMGNTPSIGPNGSIPIGGESRQKLIPPRVKKAIVKKPKLQGFGFGKNKQRNTFGGAGGGNIVGR